LGEKVKRKEVLGENELVGERKKVLKKLKGCPPDDHDQKQPIRMVHRKKKAQYLKGPVAGKRARGSERERIRP